MTPARLADLAVIIRSKNAGPYRLTFDVLLPDAASFRRVKASGVLGRDSVAKALSLKPADVTSLFELESVHAFKVTIRRPVGQSDIGESDVYGCQHHVPLMELLVA